MTRLVTCGWETGDVNESNATGGGSSGSVVSSSPTPRSPGTYCLQFSWSVYPSATNGYRQWVLPAPITDIWTRFGFYPVTAFSEQIFISFLDSSGGNQGYVSWNPTDTLMRAYTGSNTLLGTSTLPVAGSLWHTVEVRWQITSATVGTVEVWVDGQRFINATGVDNTATSNLNVQRVQIGGMNSTTITNFSFDDLAINDTNGTINNGQIGDGRVVFLRPNGASLVSNTNQSRGGTDSGANWDQVNDVPFSMSDYVYSSTVGTRDTYTLQDIPAGTWAVNCVQEVVQALNSDSGAGAIGLTLVSGSTTVEGTAQTLVISAQNLLGPVYETDPNTGAAWTNAAVNALEAGTTVR